MAQKYTSANTSINSSKMPKIYRLVKDKVTPDMTVIDYGCGKFFDSYETGMNCVGYDPYNRPDDSVLTKEYDVALCSNVLNVIAERKERLDLLDTLWHLAPITYITVYEGDGSEKGRETKKDCYQLNRKAGSYGPELVEVFGPGNVKWNKRGFFECYRKENK